MKIYILRHAEAVDASGASSSVPDEWRYLTEKGCRSAENAGKRLAKQGKSARLIVSSPLVRAVQTAQIVAGRIGKKCRVEINGLLLPGADVSGVVDYLHGLAETECVVLVGHEPQLGELTMALLKHEAAIQLKKTGCVELNLNSAKLDKPARFVSYMIPGRKRITSLKKAIMV